MNKSVLHLLMMMLAMQIFTLHAQTTERPKPGFSLSIEAADVSHLSAGYPSDYHKLLVTYTNLSGVDEIFQESDSARGLDMIVLLDGAPAEETNNMHRLRKERNPGPDDPSAGGVLRGGSVKIPTSVKPGKSITFPLEISSYFNMTKPGTYTITVTKETDPNHPAKSVTVWSNTLTIDVPEPGAAAPQ